MYTAQRLAQHNDDDLTQQNPAYKQNLSSSRTQTHILRNFSRK